MQGVNDGEEVAVGLLINFIINYHLFKSTSDSFFSFVGVIFFYFFVKLRIIKLSVAFFFVIFSIKNDYSFSFIGWFYNDVCTSDELLEGFSLMFKEVVCNF